MRSLAFTCVLPVHAGDDVDHFSEAIESLRASTLAPDDILICEDGALTSPLRAVVDGASRTLGARSIVNAGPRGLHHNLNNALPAVRTPWVARCDADDINLPNRFEDQTRFLAARPEIGVLGSDLVEFWPDGRTRGKTMPSSHPRIVAWSQWRNPINHNTVFYRVDDVLAAGGYPDVPFKEDYALWLRLMARGVKFANLGDALVRARLGATFYRRRASVRALAGEWKLLALKRRVGGLGGPMAGVAFAARSAVLASSSVSRLVYEHGLRRREPAH